MLSCCGKVLYSISPVLTFTGISTKASSSSDMPIDAGLQADQVAIIVTSSAFPGFGGEMLAIDNKSSHNSISGG